MADLFQVLKDGVDSFTSRFSAAGVGDAVRAMLGVESEHTYASDLKSDSNLYGERTPAEAKAAATIAGNAPERASDAPTPNFSKMLPEGLTITNVARLDTSFDGDVSVPSVPNSVTPATGKAFS